MSNRNRNQRDHIYGSSRLRPRPRLQRSVSQWRNRIWDWKCLSINDDTETENVLVSRARLRPTLERCESQWQDRDRDWKCLSLNDETKIETEKIWVSMRKPRLGLKKSESEGRGWVKDVDTKIPSKLLLTTAPTLVSGIYFAYRVTPKTSTKFVHRCVSWTKVNKGKQR